MPSVIDAAAHAPAALEKRKVAPELVLQMAPV
jgi:hypothetical protein